MLERKGDMFQSWINLEPQDRSQTGLCVTTNAYINSRGQLVMGRGAALQAATLEPYIKTRYATYLLENKLNWSTANQKPVYGHYHPHGMRIGIFQVKYMWNTPAEIDLIKRSTEMLNEYLHREGYPPYWLNFPGIGNGRLNVDDVREVIKTLPDNVVVWQYAI